MSFISVATIAYCMLFVMSSHVDTTTTFADFKKFMVGDNISPVALIPIATHLLSKVEEPGIGKGFVSSTKTPKELADKLFEAFFSTTNQEVTIKDRDVAGIEALQYLAMNGPDRINRKTPISSSRKYLNSLSAAAQKSWHLVNKRRNELKRKGNKNELNEQYILNLWNEQKGKRTLSGCRWKYECEDTGELDTCVLHTFCKDSVLEDGKAKTYRRAAAQKIQHLQIRKWLGITEIDEELEKILETRHAADHSDYIVDENLKKLTDRFENIMDRYLASSTDRMGLQ